MISYGGYEPGHGQGANDAPNADELAVLDFVSGLTTTLPDPTEPACRDRDSIDELVATRDALRRCEIPAPAMQLTFKDVLAAKAETDRSNHKVIYWLTGPWGLKLIAAAACLVLIAGAFFVFSASGFGKVEFKEPAQVEQYERYKYPTGYSEAPSATGPSQSFLQHGSSTPLPSSFRQTIRNGSITLQHDDPAQVQQQVISAARSLGGDVKNLTRSGTENQAYIQLTISIPAEAWAQFLGQVEKMGEVTAQNENAEDVSGTITDYEALLAESKSHLASLDKLAESGASKSLTELQNLQNARRATRLEIERYQRALDGIKHEVAFSSLTVTINSTGTGPATDAGAFQRAWDKGTGGLIQFTAFLMMAAIAGLPVILSVALVMLIARNRRRRIEQGE